MHYYREAEDFAVRAFTKKGDELGAKHLLRTVYWLKKLKPDADEALCIAAVAHDIERAFRDSSYDKIAKSEKGFMSEDHLTHHQNEGARIMFDFLTSRKADKKIAERVMHLISRHEVGGDADQDLVKDADSISFFENNVDHFIMKKTKETSKAKVKDKFDWTFSKISSEKAKKIARPMYESALRKLARA